VLRNLLRAGALALALFIGPQIATQQAANPNDFPNGFFPKTTYVSHPNVEKIQCDKGSGTGFKLQSGLWASVNHVTKMTGCRVDGLPINVVYADPVGDFSLFEVPGDNRFGGIPVSCGGFYDGQWVYGIGHGRGDPWPQVVAVRYSALYTFMAHNGWAILDVNRFVPGMSGGVVLDAWGRAVGTVNAFGLFMKISMSKPLAETPLCKK
jgi:hypothetical protein